MFLIYSTAVFSNVLSYINITFIKCFSYLSFRNLVNKIKRKSIREYFIERCVGGPKQKDFWPTIKPFITNKDSYFENNIILTDDDRIFHIWLSRRTSTPLVVY
jgi:hypothetical protein